MHCLLLGASAAVVTECWLSAAVSGLAPIAPGPAFSSQGGTSSQAGFRVSSFHPSFISAFIGFHYPTYVYYVYY